MARGLGANKLDAYRSENLAGLDLDELVRFIDIKPMTRAVRE